MMNPENERLSILKRLPINKCYSMTPFIMILNDKSSPDTIEWLLNILEENHLQLSILKFDSIVSKSSDNELIITISCDDKLIHENFDVVYKQLKRQCMDPVDNDELNTSEKQRVLHDIIQRICLPYRATINVGFTDITLYPGQSIIEICCHYKIIQHLFPLHDHKYLDELRSNYCQKFSDIDYVRNYFGEMIGFYFAFLAYYRNMFCWTSIIYLTCWLLQLSAEFYTLIICFCSFMFVKLWKRYSKCLAFRWGTLDLIQLEKARPTFRSKFMEKDTVTNEYIPYYPLIKTWFKEYFISIPFVVICLCLSFELMLYYFDCEIFMTEIYESNPSFLNFVLCFMPSIIYAIIVMFMNHLYILIATKLNDYENHKTQESHENHLIVKLVLFEFFNNFICLFYIAFYMKDFDMLRYTLITMLTVNKTVENFLEVFIPMYLIYRNEPNKLFRSSSSSSLAKKDLSLQQQIYDEKQLFIYEHTYYDCLELFIQYGYAFLFVSIWPWSPIVAAINSIMEVRMDAAKLVYCKRRPFQRSMKSINNAWIKSFEVLSIIIVISNFLTLEAISPQIVSISSYFNLSTFHFIVYAEHIFLTLILIFWYVVPDIPRDIQHQLNRRKYLQSKIVYDKKTD